MTAEAMDALTVWKPDENPPPAGWDGKWLYAVRSGKFKISYLTFRVYMLNDGQRVIDASDVEAMFAGEQ